MMTPQIRRLEPADLPVLEAFLQPRLASSMFLLGNARDGALHAGEGRPRGVYMAAFEEGAMVGVVAQFWNGYIIPQAPRHLDTLWRAVVRESGRDVVGVNGPGAQAFAVVDAIGMTPADCLMYSRENLYRLDLDVLIVPPALADGRVRGRPLAASDLDTVARWFAAYSMEALHEEDSPRLHVEARARAEYNLEQAITWVVEVEGELVAMSSFNTRLAEAVQIGGVYTPPALRGRGHARAAVAQSLLDARADGAGTAILFTGDDDTAADRAYRALGFQVVGDYAIVYFRTPVAAAEI
ncbi:MAG: GNAT family N-acetyltransferase [Caldilineaceae bacterium]|nr:GNAT family N-acetyltransferase [Caldilineaceae bacterium]